MCFICSSGRSRKRVKMTIKSALSRASRPGMLLTFGLIVPSAGSIANKTVQRNPWRFARIFPSCGSASSERYSSSPLTRTMCLPLPGPSPPSYVTPAANSGRQVEKTNATLRITAFIVQSSPESPGNCGLILQNRAARSPAAAIIVRNCNYYDCNLRERPPAMRNLPVFWHEGMFLRPQHFQAADRYWSELAEVSQQLDHPYYYGLR